MYFSVVSKKMYFSVGWPFYILREENQPSLRVSPEPNPRPAQVAKQRRPEPATRMEIAMANEQSEVRTDLSLWCTRPAAHYTEKKNCREPVTIQNPGS